LSSEEQEVVKAHLIQCAKCRKVQEVLESQQYFFRGAVRHTVPEKIWQNILGSITEERLAKERLGIFGRIRDYIIAPRPALVWASAFTMFIFAMFFAGMANQKRHVLRNSNGQVSVEITNNLNDVLLYGLGTDVEKYFL
ncbi:MAG: zf-HC2 domain-containing protein, partial [Candidatus Omnitrophica bacterium]|nr:zf-HC2 domain-containing protein [Candidatus Omnitrophota bacterium]